MQTLDHPALWKLITTFGKFHSAKELFVFMLAHFLPTLFDNTRHKVTFLGEIVSATVVRKILSAYWPNQTPPTGCLTIIGPIKVSRKAAAS